MSRRLSISRCVLRSAIAAVGRASCDPAATTPFSIASLTAIGATVIAHSAITADGRGGIAVSNRRVFCTGDSMIDRFALSDLSGGGS